MEEEYPVIVVIDKVNQKYMCRAYCGKDKNFIRKGKSFNEVMSKIDLVKNNLKNKKNMVMKNGYSK